MDIIYLMFSRVLKISKNELIQRITAIMRIDEDPINYLYNNFVYYISLPELCRNL